MTDAARAEDATTVPALLQRSAARFGAKSALATKRGGKWTHLSYAELAEAVDLFARGLAARGVLKGDRVAILAPNSPEWQIADLGALHLGAITVPIYTSLTPDQTAFILRDSGAKWLVVAPEKAWRALDPLRATLPALEGAILVETERKGDITLRDVTVAGRAARARDPGAFEAAWRAVAARDDATLVYTSGTTGEPKGVVLTHGNMAYNAETMRRVLDVRESDVGLCFLPLAHSFERTAELVGLAAGATGYYAESIAAMRENLAEVRPTILFAVPRVFDKLHAGVLARVAAAPAWKRRAFDAALAAGARVAGARERGRGPGPLLAARAALLRRAAFGELARGLGGRLRFFVSTGAPLNPEVARFFWAAGFDVYEGYGLTEAGPALAFNHAGAWRRASVGRAIPATELRIAEDGEVLARGPGVMRGYWNRPRESAETFAPGGWLRTGDTGQLDDGFLRITGRKKELIVKSNGKKVAPAPIQAALEASPLVAQAVVLGDDRPFLVALLAPAFDALREAAGLAGAPDADVAASPAARAALAGVVADVNASLANHEQVKAFHVLPRELTQEAGELTPTLKVKRRVVAERYAKDVERLYAGV